MFQDSIRLLVHPNKETILDIIQSVTFKGAICLYTLAWVILRIIMGNAGIDVLHILPILDHKLVYVNYIIVFIVDYIYIMFKTIILASLLWLLLKWWHSTSLKSFIVMTIYSMGLCFLFASIKFYLQSYFLSLNYLDNNWSVNDTLRMYKNDDIRMYNFNCITDTIVEVITTCNTYTLLTVHLL